MSIAETYDRDGFVFPIDAINESEAKAIRAELERGEADLDGDPKRLGLLRAYTNRLMPAFDRLVRNRKLVGAAAEVLGPDLMVWNAGLFIKEASSPHIVSWHQDLTYWGLDEVDEVTAWVALSPSNLASGCMRFVPGSHKKHLMPHRDTFAANNLLTRGQEIAVEVDDSDGVDVVLQTGQASLHHGHLFHASGPNRTDDRRIGVAIRYIKPSMRQRTGDRSLVTLVAGEDRFDHFKLAGPPKGFLHDDDFADCAADADIKARVLYEGAEGGEGKRFREG
ncbi:MAG: phytanoyl-CoA dioxygenase family protein [Alphaproteobacteria bacterium]